MGLVRRLRYGRGLCVLEAVGDVVGVFPCRVFEVHAVGD